MRSPALAKRRAPVELEWYRAATYATPVRVPFCADCMRRLALSWQTVTRRARHGLVLSLLVGPLQSRAQEAEALRERTLALDNDYFVFARDPRARSDDNYTHGITYTYTAAMPRILRTAIACGPGAVCPLRVSVGQWMFSPVNEAADPLPGERPHAGFLFLSTEAQRRTPATQMGVSVILGVTGPPSLAEATQRAFHAAVPGFREPLGWEHQLPTEVAGSAAVSLASLRFFGDRERFGLQIVPGAAAEVGTLRAAGRTTVSGTVGWGVHHPWVSVSSAPAGVYAFGRVQYEYVARSLFLDGSTFTESVRVTRTPLIRDLQSGVGLRFEKLLFEYSVTTRSREYRTGPASHSFGRMSVSWGNYR